MNAAELFVRCLQAEGVEYIFGVPGEENADIMMAIEAAGMPFVLTRHEQGAAFMGDVYGRLTGKAARGARGGAGRGGPDRGRGARPRDAPRLASSRGTRPR